MRIKKDQKELIINDILKRIKKNEPINEFITKKYDITRQTVRNYINELERKVSITAFILEYNGYVTQDAYMAEPQPQIQTIKDNNIQYAPLRIAFIGYWYD